MKFQLCLHRILLTQALPGARRVASGDCFPKGSLIASCKLHGRDPESYLAEVIHVMPHWPRDRYLELCPRDWSVTRARLNPAELERELGWITIPPLLATPKQQSSAD